MAWLRPFPRPKGSGRSLLVVTGILVALGTVAVASASEGQSSANGGLAWGIVIHDLAYLVVGLFALYVAARIHLGTLIARAPVLIAGAGALLVAVRLVGVSVNGGQRWLNLKVIYLQPSEIFKLATVLFVAWVVERHEAELHDWRSLALHTAPVTLGAGLIVLQPDLGTASVVLAVALVMLAVAGLERRLVTRIVLLGAVGVGVFMKAKPYSAARFFAFLHPHADLQGANFQLWQSKIGLGAGGLTGLGLGHSREKWGLLPNPHTDFVFTIFGEELGFIGAIVVLGLFVWFLMSALSIAQRASRPAYRLLAVGIATWIVLEAALNVASVVGLWAVTGVPLPFFSYGGTALITELCAVGLLYNVAHDVTAARPRRRVEASARPRSHPTPRSRATARPLRVASPTRPVRPGR
jgi:cell division protein FtsW